MKSMALYLVLVLGIIPDSVASQVEQTTAISPPLTSVKPSLVQYSSRIFTNPQECDAASTIAYQTRNMSFSHCNILYSFSQKSLTFDKCLTYFCDNVASNVLQYQRRQCMLKYCSPDKYESTPQQAGLETYVKFTECDSSNNSTCKNGGSCVHFANYLKCQCPTGFRRSTCHETVVVGGPFAYVFTFPLLDRSFRMEFLNNRSKDFNELSSELKNYISKGLSDLADDIYDIPLKSEVKFSAGNISHVVARLSLSYEARQDPGDLQHRIHVVMKDVHSPFLSLEPKYIVAGSNISSSTNGTRVPPQSTTVSPIRENGTNKTTNCSDNLVIFQADYKEGIMSTCDILAAYENPTFSLQDCVDMLCASDGNVINFQAGLCQIRLCKLPNLQIVNSAANGGFQIISKSKQFAANCGSDPCFNGGTCMEQSDGFICRCPTGFNGILCELLKLTTTESSKKTITSRQPEVTESETTVESSSVATGTTPFDTTETLQESMTTTFEVPGACDSNPCLNDASCSLTSLSAFRCQCNGGFYGERCEFVKVAFKYKFRFRIKGLNFEQLLSNKESNQYQTLSTRLENHILPEYAKRVEPEDTPANIDFEFSSGSLIVDSSLTFVAPQDPVEVMTILRSILSDFDTTLDIDPIEAQFTAIPKLFVCDFESIDICGMVVERVASGINWIRHSGPTPLAGTGPSGASNGLYYMYIDTRNIPQYDFSDFLLTPQLEYHGEVCLRLSYHMAGPNVGNLFLLLREGEDVVQYVWGHGGIDTDDWQSLVIPLNITGKTQQIALQGAPLAGGFGDIAVDNLIIDLDMSSCKSGDQCGASEIGPHPDECLLELWTARCHTRARGNPISSHSTREFLDQYNLGQVKSIIKQWAQKANVGVEPWLTQCYGSEYIRLVGGSRPSRGRVEVYRDGIWSSICDDGFGDEESTVVCRQLGYMGGEARSDAYYGEGPAKQPITLYGLACVGNETSLYQCPTDSSHGWTCFHDEDAGVLCAEDMTGPMAWVGADVKPRPETDDTEGAIFIPDLNRVVQKAGTLVSWSYWCAETSVEFYLQIWRLTSLTRQGETFKLVGQSKIMSENSLGNHTTVLKPEDTFSVAPGDVLGIYFPDRNPVPWSSQACYSVEEQVRYINDPITVEKGMVFNFRLAPLAWKPCRAYSMRASIENHEETTFPPIATTPSPIEIPEDSVYFCSFEPYEQCTNNLKEDNNDFTWSIHTGQTDSLGTGPDLAHLGDYYLYVEASYLPEGTTTSFTTPTIDYNGQACLSFYYHMFGAGIGRLTVRDSSATIVWGRMGPSENRWILAQQPVLIVPSQAFTFSATLGRTIQGDIAVDDVLVTPGICIPPNVTTTPKPNLTSTTVPPINPLPEEMVVFLSSNGEDLLTCGSREQPCQTFRVAVSRPAKAKIIIVITKSDDFLHELNMDWIHRSTVYLNIRVLETRDVAKLNIVGSPRANLGELKISEMELTGDLRFESCPPERLILRLEHVTMTSDDGSVISLPRCKTVVLRISFCSIGGYKISFTSTDFTDAEINDSTIHGNYLLTENGNHSNSGIQGYFPSRNSKHMLKLKNTLFSNLAQDPDVDAPLGAVVMRVDKDSTELKVFVSNCTFISNHRAMDLSLKGPTVVEIVDTYFINNHATGSGGALRFTPTLQKGFGALAVVSKAKIIIQGCVFENNTAVTSELYQESDLYYQSRSPGSGGAVYTFITVPSPLPRDGIVSISECQFKDNKASVQGGTIFNSPGISLEIFLSTLSNSDSGLKPKFGDVLYSLCNMTVRNTSVEVKSSDGSTPIFSYQASDPSNARLFASEFFVLCPAGYWVEQLNTSSLAAAGGLDTFQLYCRACPDERYSLELSSVRVVETFAHIQNPVNCLRCPYGADCNKGIWNNPGFWGSVRSVAAVDMYQCPEDYCETNRSITPIAFDACAEHRVGTLCGRCQEGYSESMFGTECIRDENCGVQNWYIILFLVVYGILYLLFFMFEHDWARLVRWLSVKIKRKSKGADKEEVAQAADLAGSGYFQSFMYFIQTSVLLKVDIVIEEDEVYQYIHRPQDILPQWLIDGFRKVLNFDILFFQGKTCVIPGLTPVMKVLLKFSFVLYLFMLLLLLYVLSGFCCFWMLNRKRPRIGQISMNARMLGTIVALSLYTYQAVAEDAFLLLNCANVNGRSVLYLDGNVDCLQSWQWSVIILVCIFVVPFFVVLLFGPKLLERRLISLGFFFVSMLFPLFLAPAMIVLYCGCYKREVPPKAEEEDEGGKVRCCGDQEESREAIVGAMVGPYREDILDGLCWEGIINFRRLLLVVLFTFINDRLLKQIALSFGCFVILIVHLKTNPFKQRFSNYAESTSLAMLLIISGTNLVKAAFYHSQAVPRAENYLVIVVYEWIEALCLGILPILLLGLVLAAMIIKTGSKLMHKLNDQTPSSKPDAGNEKGDEEYVESDNHRSDQHQDRCDLTETPPDQRMTFFGVSNMYNGRYVDIPRMPLGERTNNEFYKERNLLCHLGRHTNPSHERSRYENPTDHMHTNSEKHRRSKSAGILRQASKNTSQYSREDRPMGGGDYTFYGADSHAWYDNRGRHYGLNWKLQ